jgi:aminoglycoside N3'-acetyltransferase
MRSPADLATDMQALGVRPGDRMMVHASLRRIGPVVGGAAGVVAAIDGALGPTGTWLMVYGARDDHAWVNTRPEAQRAALLADATPFDRLRTPVLPEVGVLAEVMRTTPGTVVNDHPEGRFGARGQLAVRWLTDTPWDDYYGPGSVLERFVAAGGQVLRMGADPDTVTVLHHAEYLADVPDTLRVRRHRLVATPEGPRIVVVECLDDEDGIVPVDRQPAEDYFAIILRQFLAAHPHRSGRVGDAEAQLLDAGALVRFGADWMTRNLR